MPNSDSAPWMQAGPVANSSPVPTQPANMDDLVVEFMKKLDQLAYEKFGVMPKHRTYVKPYPEYFDLQPYPPGYRVPEFSKFNGVDNKSTWEHISQYLANLEIMGVSLVAMVMEGLVLAAVMGDNSTTTVNFLGGRGAMGINSEDSILVRILLMAGIVEVTIGVVLIFVVLLPVT